MYKKILILLILIITIGCAKRGYITGGEKDILPPTVLKTTPENFSTNFNSKEISIVFDEYVKLKDVSKNLIISPPLKNRPDITPYSASRQIKIRFRDTLQPNTTYSLNFGQSIEDNNEGNKLQGYRYVFSTGNYIDSLSVSGSVKDALNQETDKFVSVMLYEAGEQFNDSIIYKENPRYITNTLDSLTTFTIENLKEGKYLLVALKDKNNNYKFEPKSDKIGFHKELITIPSEEKYDLVLFNEVPNFKPVRAFEEANNKIVLGYEGNPENKKIELRNGNQIIETKISKVADKDSLNIWFKPFEADSLQLAVFDNDKLLKSYNVKRKEKKQDSLKLALKTSKRMYFKSNIVYNSSTPITKFDASKISLLDKDSIKVDFTTQYDSLLQNFEVIFQKDEKQKYYFTMYPEALTDFFGKSNDTITSEFSTQNYSDYGNLKLIMQNLREFPVIVQLTDNNGKVLEEIYSEQENTVEFFNILPNMYNLRIIYDSNRNKKWDTGNYLQKLQPEKVIYYPGKIDLRANWDVEQTFILKE